MSERGMYVEVISLQYMQFLLMSFLDCGCKSFCGLFNPCYCRKYGMYSIVPASITCRTDRKLMNFDMTVSIIK